MTAFLSRPQSEELERSFALGTGGTLPILPQTLGDAIGALDGRGQALAALSLVAQHRRFGIPVYGLPEAPADSAIKRMHGDQRPVIPDAARLILKRIFSLPDKNMSALLAGAALDRLAVNGLRPHVFDLPRLQPLLRERMTERPESLGQSERAYMALALSEAGGTGQSYMAEQDIDAESWRDFTPAPRMAFLRRLRRDDPERGRALIEECFADEPASNRAEMVATLSVRLSGADEDFLTSSLSDRAQSVKTAAQALLARLPGTEDYDRRLADLGGMLSLGKTGIVKRRQVLKVTLPKRSGQRMTIMEALAGLRLADIARRSGFDPADTPGLISDDDDDLSAALIAAAFAGEDYRLAVRIAEEAAASSWIGCLNDLLPVLEDHPRQPAVDVMLALVARAHRIGATAQWDWLQLYNLLRAPLPDAVWRDVFTSRSLEGIVKLAVDGKAGRSGTASAELFTTLALLVPDSAAADFMARVAPLGPIAVAPMQTFLDFQSALHSAGSNSGEPTDMA